MASRFFEYMPTQEYAHIRFRAPRRISPVTKTPYIAWRAEQRLREDVGMEAHAAKILISEISAGTSVGLGGFTGLGAFGFADEQIGRRRLHKMHVHVESQEKILNLPHAHPKNVADITNDSGIMPF